MIGSEVPGSRWTLKAQWETWNPFVCSIPKGIETTDGIPFQIFSKMVLNNIRGKDSQWPQPFGAPQDTAAKHSVAVFKLGTLQPRWVHVDLYTLYRMLFHTSISYRLAANVRIPLKNGQVAHAVVQFCGGEAKLLSWHWSKRLERFDSLHVSVWIVPGSKIKWLLWLLSMLSLPIFLRWNQKPRSAYLGSSDTSRSCSQNWSSSGILKCGFSYIERGTWLGNCQRRLAWLVSEWHSMHQLDWYETKEQKCALNKLLWIHVIVLRTSTIGPRWWGQTRTRIGMKEIELR